MTDQPLPSTRAGDLTRRLAPALAGCLLLAGALALCDCGGDDTVDQEFESVYVDDYEADVTEAAAQEAEVASLDTLDDLDEVDQEPAARPQSVQPPHGPLSILEDDPHFTDPSGAALDDARDLGADAIRVFLSWSSVVPGDPNSADRPHFNAASPAGYDWTSVDTRIRNALARNLRVLITLAAPMPYWASQEPRYCVTRHAEDLQKPPEQRTFWSCAWKPDPKQYAMFVTAVGRHIREQGWAQHIWAWTLWNEPNIGAFLLDGTIDPGSSPLRASTSRFKESLRYRKMWFVGRQALRGIAHVRARVLFGEPANDLINPGEDSGCPALCAATPADARCKTCGNADDDPRSTRWAFLRYALCLDPADGELLDDARLSRCPQAPRRVEAAGVAFHPYAPRPEVMRRSVQILQGLIDGASQAGRLTRERGIYLTEFAYLTQKGDGGLGAAQPVTLDQQAFYGNVTDHDMYDNRRVRAVTQYELFDEGRGSWESGLRFSDQASPTASYLQVVGAQRPGIGWEALRGQPKPAYAAYRISIDVQTAGAGQVEVVGLARPAMLTVALIEGKIGEAWVPIDSMPVDILGYGRKTIAAQGASAFRLYYPPYRSRETGPR